MRTRIFQPRCKVDLIGNTIISSRIQPKDIGIGQNIAASEVVDIVDGVIDHIAIHRHHDNAPEVIENMGVKHHHQIHGGAVEGIGAAADEIAIADEGFELARFVLGEEEGLHGCVLDLHAEGETAGLV